MSFNDFTTPVFTSWKRPLLKKGGEFVVLPPWTLIVRGYTTMWVSVSTNSNKGRWQTLFFTLRLDFREGRYRYELRDLGQSLFPIYAYYGDSEPAIREVNEHTYNTAAGQSGGSATVVASPRQTLFQPDRPDHPGPIDVAARFGREWPPFSAALYKTLNQLMDSLGRHVTAPTAKW